MPASETSGILSRLRPNTCRIFERSALATRRQDNCPKKLNLKITVRILQRGNFFGPPVLAWSMDTHIRLSTSPISRPRKTYNICDCRRCKCLLISRTVVEPPHPFASVSLPRIIEAIRSLPDHGMLCVGPMPPDAATFPLLGFHWVQHLDGTRTEGRR